MKRIIERIRAWIDAPYRRQAAAELASFKRCLDAESAALAKARTALRLAEGVADNAKRSEQQMAQMIGEYVQKKSDNADGPFFFPGLRHGFVWTVEYRHDFRAVIIRCVIGAGQDRFAIARSIHGKEWERVPMEEGFIRATTEEMARKIIAKPAETYMPAATRPDGWKPGSP